jgi:hypothetical protein
MWLFENDTIILLRQLKVNFSLSSSTKLWIQLVSKFIESTKPMIEQFVIYKVYIKESLLFMMNSNITEICYVSAAVLHIYLIS